jgi:hypothetical protein
MVRLSRLISDHAGITEIDVNPVIANADGLTIVDARIITKGR